MASQNLKVGGDIVYYCSKCALDLGHRILAMVGSEPARVRCNTCYSERNFRAKKQLKQVLDEIRRPIRRISSSSSALSNSLSNIYREKMKENLDKTPRNYRADERFEVGDVVVHPNFGKGVVVKLIFPDRMDVLFSDQSKTLICAAAPSE